MQKRQNSNFTPFYNFLTASKELDICKGHFESIKTEAHRARDVFQGGVWRRCKGDISAVQFMPPTLMKDSYTRGMNKGPLLK